MKRFFRLLATLLSIALFICAVPQSVLAQIGDLLDEETATQTETSSPEVYVLGEVIENRTETTKTFRLSDGSFIAADYGKTVHYADESGAWTDYDNTWQFADATADEDIAGYENKDADVRIKLANNSNSNNLLKLTFGDYKVSMHLVDADKSKALELYPAMEKPEGNDIDAASTLRKFSAGAIYKDILPDVDLEYIISGGTVKENIIIKDASDSYTYTFELKLHGLTPSVDTDGNILLQDEMTDETQLIIPAGYMYDANGAYSDAVTYNITHQNGKKYTLTVTVDADWVNADERAFPVTVDPTVEIGDASDDNVDDAYVRQSTPTTSYASSNDLYIGYSSTKQLTRAYIKPNTLPPIPDSAVIVDAKVRLFRHSESDLNDTYSGTANELLLAARKVTSSWTASSLTWNNQPTVSSTILDYNTIERNSDGNYYNWDITSVMQEWYSSNVYYGIAIYPVTEYAGDGNYAEAGFYATNYNGILRDSTRPVFNIHYRDTKGLESIWTYSSHSVGSAGTGYVNGFNGNLVFVHDDMTTQGSILPITVSHVYNSFMAGKEFTANSADVNAPITTNNVSMFVGKGWKLSVQETIVPVIIPDNGLILEDTWYVYNDSDGTEHYFYRKSTMPTGEYYSEDGNGLKLNVISSDTITMLDDYGNRKFFSNGVLRSITDVYGNVKTFSYSANRLLSIQYKPTGETSYTQQLSFGYNTSGTLKQIVNAYNDDEKITFEYSTAYNGTVLSSDSSGYLRRIIYHNDTTQYILAEYTYNSDGTLKTAKDCDTGYTVEYSYSNYSGSKRVSLVTEKVGTTTGQKIGFSYQTHRFDVQTSGLDDVYNTSDDIITTVMFDHFGRAVCSYSTDRNANIVHGTSYAEYTDHLLGSKSNNKVEVEALKGITNENLIANGSFESAGWTSARSGTNYSYARSTASPFSGLYSYKLASIAGGTGYVQISQTVSVPTAGTYTLSAYVKTIMVSASASGGAYLSLDGTESEYISGTTNTDVQNGWRRIHVTKTFTTAGNYTVRLRFANANGMAYFDCVQLEKASVPSDYNLLSDSSVRTSNVWTGNYTSSTVDSERSHVGIINGSCTETQSAIQTVIVDAPQTTTFMLSGWAKANSVLIPIPGKSDAAYAENRSFGLCATLTYSNGSTEAHYVAFNPDITEWQYAAMAIVPQTKNTDLNVESVTVEVVYEHNANTMYFDDVCLIVGPAKEYKYDPDTGKLVTATDIEGNNSSLDYYADGEGGYGEIDLKSYTTETGDKYEYTYHKLANGTNTHDIESAVRTVNSITQTLTYGYNQYGNITSTQLSATDTSESFTSSTVYSEHGNFLQSVTDSLGHVTTYDYDTTTKLLKFVLNVNGNRMGYKYDKRNRTTNVYLDGDKDGYPDTNEAAVEYLYAQNRLSGIETATTEYTLTYDTFGNLKTVKAGNKTLATYNYATNNGKLLSLTYGNNDSETYTYDYLDRLVKVVYNGIANSGYELSYDANGRLFQTIDYEAGITHTYEYDSLDRLIRAWQKNSSTGAVILAVENSYDAYGRASGSTYIIGDTTQNYGITYKDISGLLDTYTAPQNSFTYSYDKFDRLTRKLGNVHSIQYTYIAGTQRVNTYTISQATAQQTEYKYLYDALGNIRMIFENGTFVRGYSYDALNRLTHESHMQSDIVYEYSYDNAGNILTKTTKVGTTVQSTVTYGYSTSEWGDLLTNYNGTTITYDAIGNPLKWRNILYMGWEGRNLVCLTEDMIVHGVFFEYNADGIRTRKKLDDYDGTTTTHDYILDGSTILKETITSGSTTTTLYYYYDESGISGVSYNGTMYSYVRNQQGDVIGIIDSIGVTVVEYEYDAWGNILSVTGSLASTFGAKNPFRYRGYYYDTETGFYYLNSRYYDPQVGRFINADEPILLGANGGIMGYNMFAYCLNNPVCRMDILGTNSVAIFDDDFDPSDDDKDIAGGNMSNGSLGGFWNAFCGSLKDGLNGLQMASGKRNTNHTENHHLISNKRRLPVDCQEI
ncbi:MAG: DNRLRE domain-containing protein, partial [Oscillospiraceae bacterium]|nr:DNRLRE domain-containing protein [Oscillospiraceae bacterium]